VESGIESHRQKGVCEDGYRNDCTRDLGRAIHKESHCWKQIPHRNRTGERCKGKVMQEAVKEDRQKAIRRHTRTSMSARRCRRARGSSLDMTRIKDFQLGQWCRVWSRQDALALRTSLCHGCRATQGLKVQNTFSKCGDADFRVNPCGPRNGTSQRQALITANPDNRRAVLVQTLSVSTRLRYVTMMRFKHKL